MTDYSAVWDFQNLYEAHKAARRGKRGNRETIGFELDLSGNLTRLSDALREGTYTLSGYYSFTVTDPKARVIHALHYADRVVQHCLCDRVLAPALDRRLVYDNAACRNGKGTHFALDRVSGFLREHYRRYGTEGYFLKCDVRHFFDSIDHAVLRERLRRVFTDEALLKLLDAIIDSYESSPGKGLPLGNQTSQWFALYYLDGMDRLVKESLRIRHYSRYMDDCVLIHPDREYLRDCLARMRAYLEEELLLSFNEKTQIFPIRNGVDYLGWHLYLTETGRVVRKLRRGAKVRFLRSLQHMEKAYAGGEMSADECRQVLASYQAHLAHGDTWRLRRNALAGFRLRRETREK